MYIKLFLINILRTIYYIFPKFIREQYVESINFYRRTFITALKRKVDDDVIKVQLVSNFDLLGVDTELIAHKGERYSVVNSPSLYVDDQLCKRPSLKGILPDANIIRLSGVSVIGSTDAILSGEKMYHHELNLMEDCHDLKRPDIFLRLNDEGIFNYQVSFSNKTLEIDGLAISLLKEHSTNYYHWMTEVIPKLVSIIDSIPNKDEKVVILIEEGVPKQSVTVIDILLSEFENLEYELCEVKKGQLVHCENLIYCTPLWTSLDNTRYLPNPKKEFFVSSDCLKRVKSKISKNIILNSQNLPNKKIYLQRENSKLRKLSNVLDLEKLLYKKGFDFVDPGALDFWEQYDVFSQADTIIGASGAAFTNLLFMKPGSTAISLYPSAQSTNYYVFQPLADVSNVDLIHFLTTPDDNSNSVHGDAKVNVIELARLLEKLDD
ncbi:Capsular biosynthesis protein [Vibrio chagasii]|nr:Capsular biosynthesis protein [Vibrio chagasii]CAH6936849.1 Capsular biosynthesis protein [Vibrio chagasii]CAH7086351.1 Capsular biosynthesis protein [Vibrio chagasii]CAH7127209.1 Capsular biosynthesis protein [Vibrio chagasii]